MTIELPISKSIANRLLILQAIHGDGLLTVSATLPEDVRIMREAIRLLGERREARIDLGNCGTAMRFLTAYAAQLENKVTVLDGVERMRHRPIGQLVDALREIGADIEYLGEEGFPPLRIKGCILDKHRIVTINNPQSTQFVSALLLIGANVQTNSTSPYITLTREIIDQYPIAHRASNSPHGGRPIAAQAASALEKDWSSAAFWYEYVALYGGEITLPGLSRDSLQGDKVVADIFAHLGVHTTYTAEGIILSPIAYSEASNSREEASDPDDGCCGEHLVCERETLLQTNAKVEYYDDEELDALSGIPAEDYTEEQYQMIREVFNTLQAKDVPGWVRSIQLRNIQLPLDIREEALLIVIERRKA